MSKKSTSVVNVIGRMQLLRTGLVENLAGQTITIAGKSVKVDDIVKQIDAYIAQLKATVKAKSAWTDQVNATAVLEQATMDPLIVTLHGFLVAYYGRTSQTLTSYGLTPYVAKTRTAAQTVATAEKSAATRTARHTVGPRQKAAIHGAVEPAAPAATPAVTVPAGNDPAKR
jgi:hypothetical protein